MPGSVVSKRANFRKFLPSKRSRFTAGMQGASLFMWALLTISFCCSPFGSRHKFGSGDEQHCIVHKHLDLHRPCVPGFGLWEEAGNHLEAVLPSCWQTDVCPGLHVAALTSNPIFVHFREVWVEPCSSWWHADTLKYSGLKLSFLPTDWCGTTLLPFRNL